MRVTHVSVGYRVCSQYMYQSGTGCVVSAGCEKISRRVANP